VRGPTSSKSRGGKEKKRERTSLERDQRAVPFKKVVKGGEGEGDCTALLLHRG